MTTDNNIWGIHGGRTGDADLLFLTKNVIAVGWTVAEMATSIRAYDLEKLAKQV